MCEVLGLDMARLAGWRGLKVGDQREQVIVGQCGLLSCGGRRL